MTERGSKISSDLLRAYRATEYWILDRGNHFNVQIDRPSAALVQCQTARGVESAAILSAYNPGSVLTVDASNQLAHGRLRGALASAGLHWIDANAKDPSGAWPDERGCLVLGMARSHARAIARDFGQNAFVWCDAGGLPTLELLR